LNGQAQSLEIIFGCAIEDRIIGAEETNYCEYTMIFETEFACNNIIDKKKIERI
jgi:hypothetical protein